MKNLELIKTDNENANPFVNNSIEYQIKGHNKFIEKIEKFNKSMDDIKVKYNTSMNHQLTITKGGWICNLGLTIKLHNDKIFNIMSEDINILNIDSDLLTFTENNTKLSFIININNSNILELMIENLVCIYRG